MSCLVALIKHCSPQIKYCLMGAEVSSCCGGSGDKESQLDVAACPQAANSSVHKSGTESLYTQEQKDEFRNKLYEGIDVNLILQDKTKLNCHVRLDRTHEFLLLSCDDIKAVLHTSDQLRRVEASAGISDTDTCAALHLAASGNCIPLFFFTEYDKSLFVEVLESLILLLKE